jgi:hypothetical protein
MRNTMVIITEQAKGAVLFLSNDWCYKYVFLVLLKEPHEF